MEIFELKIKKNKGKLKIILNKGIKKCINDDNSIFTRV